MNILHKKVTELTPTERDWALQQVSNKFVEDISEGWEILANPLPPEHIDLLIGNYLNIEGISQKLKDLHKTAMTKGPFVILEAIQLMHDGETACKNMWATLERLYESTDGYGLQLFKGFILGRKPEAELPSDWHKHKHGPECGNEDHEQE